MYRTTTVAKGAPFCFLFYSEQPLAYGQAVRLRSRAGKPSTHGERKSGDYCPLERLQIAIQTRRKIRAEIKVSLERVHLTGNVSKYIICNNYFSDSTTVRREILFD
jgi:hypothetical protein